jgi:DNA-binding transcriptional ArsR family regulator
MTEDIDDIKKELEEVRKLKEELKKEVEEVKADKRMRELGEDRPRLHREEERRMKAEARRLREEARRVRAARPVRPPKAPRVPRVARVDLDLEGLTDSLETMMDGLGDQIEMSLRSVEGLKIPGIRLRKGRRRTKSRKEHRRDIESIAPERVAKIVAPLGNEERLKILNYLKEGGKTFNDIENFSGKTGSSLTHHLNPLIEAGYLVKGEVRGTYYVTVEGRLAYRLAQWLTHRVEKQRERTANGNSSVDIEFDDSAVETPDLDKAETHLETLAEELEEAQEAVEVQQEEIENAQEAFEEAQEVALEAEEKAREALEEEEDLDTLDWED